MSLEAEINQFRLDEEGEAPNRPVEVSDSEVGLDRSFAANFPRLIVARVDSNEEEEHMALNQRRSLRDLLADRNKGSSSKEATKSQVPPNLPLPPSLPPTYLGLNVMKDLKKKRLVQDLEEGEVAPRRVRSSRRPPGIPRIRGPPLWIVERSKLWLRWYDHNTRLGLLG